MHNWDLTPEQAIEIQKDLRVQIKLEQLQKHIEFIGGADISFNLYDDTVYAGIVILKLKDLKIVAYSLAKSEVHFPYVPGLLSFREIPPLLKAWEMLQLKPEVLVLDGQGIAHPRRFGIASHFGLLTDISTIGCGKNILYGNYEIPALESGSRSQIIDKKTGETIGYALRTKNKVNPVFISPGHKITLEESVEIIMKCVTKYRIPEPTRQAHLLVNKFRRGEVQEGYYIIDN
jgi:deoxyribonuclease V